MVNENIGTSEEVLAVLKSVSGDENVRTVEKTEPKYKVTVIIEDLATGEIRTYERKR